jgi:hypothetical protein
MQDEVTKHTKKIYKAVKNPYHSIGEKVKETIVEIFIIVFAVTLSIWLHNWSEQRHEQKEVKEFLTGLKSDLTADIKQLEENKSIVTRLDANFKFVLAVNKNDAALADSVISHHLYFDLGVTKPNIGRYDGFKSSGKIGNIENDSLKENILVFYQQTLANLEYGESYVNTLQSKILDLEIDNADRVPLKAFVTSIKMQSLLGLGAHNFEVNIDEYNRAIALAKTIVAQIDDEVK